MIVFAGEDQNDCAIMADLVRAHRPDLSAAAKLVRINDPVRLRRKSGKHLAEAARVLVGKARAKALQQKATLLGFVVHEDLDGYTDRKYQEIRTAVTGALARECGGSNHTALALAAWESEGWLLLFPNAFPHVNSGWIVPAQLRGRDFGRLREPKEELKKRLGAPVFRERDGASVARKAREHDLISALEGKNDSYTDFINDLKGWT
ncbi:hypothetical protein AA958_10855 [Streptomyces sp. CNQ-509]|uniref:hypothetical protein n=1 Tax=unclassified Streptomyces TaxID=2593676 RepID=UPI00062DCCF0|nr:hypothetical protein [Streptomyces sp. CNQ-509]AKH82643.1 hypothetical protein AA958_10855 [Streptomyces sp. CNQ-509]